MFSSRSITRLTATTSSSLLRTRSQFVRCASDNAKQAAQMRERQIQRESQKKAEQRRLNKLKDEARRATKSPLCMDVETALRYLRAAEVGRPASSTTVSLNVSMIADKGAALMQGTYRLPKPLEEQRIAVFTNDPQSAADAKRAGATMVGSDELLEQVRNGNIDFERAYATPDMVSRLNQVARILGPKGLMPSAKRGTVTSNIYDVLTQAVGETVYKQKATMLSLPIGRADFSDIEIVRNIIAVTDSLRSTINGMDSKKAPSLGKATISSAVGPHIVIEI